MESVSDWSRLRAAATVGELAPSIQLSEASAIARGLGLDVRPAGTHLPTAAQPVGTSVPPAGQKVISAGPEDKAKPEKKEKKGKPVEHVQYTGNCQQMVRTLVVRSSVAFSGGVPSVSSDDLVAAAKSGLTAATVNVPLKAVIKHSGKDAILEFLARPSS